MATSFSDYLAETKRSINEISVHELQQQLASRTDLTVIDIREADELTGGVIPSAKLVPRGFLELRVESIQPDRTKPLAIICAGGTRSALGTKSVSELGYEDVVSVAGGMGAWARAGFAVVAPKTLTDEQKARYTRQIRLPQVGEEGQQRLLASKVLCVGAGGLGSPLALYLAAGGVGTLGIIDNDVADVSNLQRQILHHEGVVGTPKVDSARQTLSRLNSGIEIRTYDERLTSENVIEIFSDYDIIVDGTDNFPTRYLINDACVFLGKPNVHGSIFYFDGQCTVFNHDGGPCYRCLYPEPPPPQLAPSCAEAGVLGAVCGVIGAMQAVEVMKLIVTAGEPLAGRLLSCDVLNMEFRQLKIRRDPSCPVCSESPTITALIDYEQFCDVTL